MKGYLGAARFYPEEARSELPTGVATGMAWTEMGGEVLFIEATALPGGGGLTLTGQLGEVMRESAQAAFSYAKSRAKELEIDEADFATYDIHIHIPEGAIPKDGPSAGITLAVAMVSVLSQRAVRKDVAMTGEITLRGNVLPVGGVKEKVCARARTRKHAIILRLRTAGIWMKCRKTCLRTFASYLSPMRQVFREALKKKPQPQFLPEFAAAHASGRDQQKCLDRAQPL